MIDFKDTNFLFIRKNIIRRIIMKNRLKFISSYASIAVIVSVLIIPSSNSQASNADRDIHTFIIEKGAINSSAANEKVLDAGHQLEGGISKLSQGASKYAGDFIPSGNILGISALELIIRIIILLLIVIGERTVSFTLGRCGKKTSQSFYNFFRGLRLSSSTA
jgi:hypothetical protein